MDIGNRIKQLRMEHGFSQAQLAEKLKIKTSQLGRYEINKCSPALNHLINLADILEVSLDYLITGNDNKIMNKAGFQDKELIELFRKSALLKKLERERLKWVINSLIKIDSNNK